MTQYRERQEGKPQQQTKKYESPGLEPATDEILDPFQDPVRYEEKEDRGQCEIYGFHKSNPAPRKSAERVCCHFPLRPHDRPACF